MAIYFAVEDTYTQIFIGNGIDHKIVIGGEIEIPIVKGVQGFPIKMT